MPDLPFARKIAPGRFIAPHVAELPKSGIRAFFDIVAQRKDVISLGVGEPDFTTPWHICRAAQQAIQEGWTHYTSNLGMPQLRQAICRYAKRRFNASYNWENEVLVGVGVSEMIDAAIRAICSPGDEIIYHEPCFVSYAATIRLAHATPVAVETSAKDEFILTAESLKAKVSPRTKAILLNFPCNPTGATLSFDEMEKIADFAIEHDLLIIADEVYSELSYDGEPKSFSSIKRLRDRLLYLNGFSKGWAMTGFRLGYACGPAWLIDPMMKIHQYGIMSAPTISQIAGIEALDAGDDDVVEMREEYRRRRNYLVSSLNEMGLATIMPKGAFYVFPSIASTGLSSNEFAVRLLNEFSVACVPGPAFGKCAEGFVRCSYATSMEKIKIAVDRIGAFTGKIKSAGC